MKLFYLSESVERSEEIMHETVEKFLSEEKKPEKYNFEYEFPVKNYDDNLPVFDRYFIYQAYKAPPCLRKEILEEKKIDSEEYKTQGDPDGWNGKCRLTLEVYQKLWNWSKESRGGYGEIKGFGWFGGDTMNSVQTTLNICMREIVSAECSGYDAEIKEYNSRFSIQLCFCLFHEHKDAFTKKLGKVKGLEQYINTYHTLGNFVLVPAGFNRARALRTQDFWDKSLGLLKNEGFDTLRSSRFEEKQFHRYINYFFLWDCVAIKDGKYDVRFLFPLEDGKEEKKKRRTQKEKLEESKKQIEDFLKAACECIERRGIFMAAMLKIATKAPETYKEIQEKVFLTDETYSGYGEVIGKIEEVTKDASASKLVEEILKECGIERLFEKE